MRGEVAVKGSQRRIVASPSASIVLYSSIKVVGNYAQVAFSLGSEEAHRDQQAASGSAEECEIDASQVTSLYLRFPGI